MEENPQSVPDPKKIPLIMAGIMLCLLLAALDGTIVNIVMPAIIKDLGGMEYYVWPFALYMLASTISLVIVGKFSDLFGRKRIFQIGIFIFLIGSVLCGIAPDMISLLLFRGIQGIGGGILLILPYMIVADIFPARERGIYLGVLATVWGAASIFGPVFGGLITDTAGWHWVFFINVPIGIIAAIIIMAELPETVVIPEKRHVDYAGITTFVGGIVPLFLALSCGGTVFDWTSPLVIGLLIIAAVMLFLFVRTQKKTKDSILPLYLFTNSIYSITAIANFLSCALLYVGIIYLPLFMQVVLKTSVSMSGMIVTFQCLASVIASNVMGRIISATGRYKPAAPAGFIIMGAGIVMLALITAETSLAFIVLASILLGTGSGILYPILAIAAQNAMPRKDLSVVTSSQQFFRNMGVTILTPVFGFIMYAGLGNNVDKNNLMMMPVENVAHAIQLVFIFCIVIIAVSIVLTLFLEEIPLRDRPGPLQQELPETE